MVKQSSMKKMTSIERFKINITMLCYFPAVLIIAGLNN